MSIKDEFEKLLQAHVSDLEAKDAADCEYYALQVRRFQAMWPAIDALLKSFPCDFVRVRINSPDVLIEIGRWEGEDFCHDVLWEIGPNFDVNLTEDPASPHLKAENGVSLREVRVHRFPDYEETECTSVFERPSELLDYIADEAAKEIAHPLHLQSRKV